MKALHTPIAYSRGPVVLLIAQIVAHLSLIPMILYAEPKHYLIAGGVYFLTGCFGMSMTFHRLISHNSWPAPRWFRYLGVLLGSWGLTGSALAWACVHRDHHRYSDRPGDPHSPHQQNWWRVQFLSMFYRPRLRAGKELLRDPWIVWTHRNYFVLQLLFIAGLALLDPFAIIYAYLVPAAILWEAGSAINTISHFFGYRRFATNDHSHNNPVLGVLMWGEGWHNNHHRFPRSANFSRGPFELDISYWFIRLFGGASGSK